MNHSLSWLLLSIFVFGCGGTIAAEPKSTSVASQNRFLFPDGNSLSTKEETTKENVIHPRCVTKLLELSEGRVNDEEYDGEEEEPNAEPVNFLDVEKDRCAQADGKISIEGKKVEFIPTLPSDIADGREVEEYEVIGRLNEQVVVSHLANFGGTGYFSTVMIVKLEGQTLRLVDTLASGDRCDGGISNVRIVDKKLHFTSSIDPVALLELSEEGKKLAIKPYEDLEASATSCVGDAVFIWNGQEANLSHVEIETDAENEETVFVDREGWTENYRYQRCFNALMREVVSQHKAGSRKKLDRSVLSAFATSFRQRCVEIRRSN